MNSEVECPLCTQIGFQSVDALRIALVSAASRNLTCPVCNASLTGLDKLTVHLFGHSLPQHELHNVGQPVRIINDAPNIATSVTPPSMPKPIILMPQELTKKVEITPPCTIPVQNFNNFQNETICNKAPETTSLLNQDLSSLLCWLPLTCFSDKLPNPAVGNIGSVHCDVLNSRTTLNSQQNDEKVDSRHSLGIAETNTVNKEASFIIVGLPSLQDVKRQVPISNNSNTNDLSLSDISNLSGKLLMLDCSGSSQLNNNVSINDSSKPSSVQISMPEQSNSHTTPISMLPQNQNALLPNREVISIATTCNIQDDIEQSKQGVEGGTPNAMNKVFKCPMCLLQFPDSDILSLHQQLVHEGSDSLQSRLTDPTKESNREVDPTENKGEGSFHCHLCSKTFHMQGRLLVHLRVVHATPTMVGLASRIKGSLSDPAPASTVLSPGSTSAKNAKDQLQGKNTDNKQWECSDCGKFFTTKYFLKKHKRLHTGEMPYSCPTCSKSFTFQQSYHKHLLYHSDEKPHTCSECGRSFKELSTLHNHQRIHTGEKPWACETCGKCFRQRVSYLVHRRIHTGAMPYCCAMCNRSFRYKVSQRTHKCIAQSASCSTRQSGDLLQRLLFDQPEKTTSTQDQEREVKAENLTHEQEQTQFKRLNQPDEVQSNPKIPQPEQQGGEHQTQLLFSPLNNDKAIFPQRLEPNTSDFSLNNFQLQQALSNIQTQAMSQNSVVLQNVPLSLKDNVKQTANNLNVNSENNLNINSTWCADKQSSSDLNPSSLVAMVNDKEMISADLPTANAPISLLQVLQKEKFTHEFPTICTNSVQSSAPCPDAVKITNPVTSTLFVPDFLSMAMSASTPTQNPTVNSGCGTSNVSINNDPFHWEVSLDMPSHDQNDSTTYNVSASQEAIDTLQTFLFGSPSTEL